jgi:hypothetical protein
VILSVDEEVAERAAELQRDYRAAGGRRDRERRLRTPDALILATSDVEAEGREEIGGHEKWPRVPGLRVRVRLIRER